MCGIAGHWRVNGTLVDVDLATMQRCLQAKAHRGPDAEGVWQDPKKQMLLGHRRLSVIDLSDAAAQPMVDPETGVALVFNGEIYNYLELRKGLEAGGVTFRSSGDSEVLLRLYLRHGTEAFAMLRGMFALAIWDSRQQQLILARDPTGKKPLYYSGASANGFEFRFASEINALKQLLGSVDLTLDSLALEQYLASGYVWSERTLNNEIRELLPGHFAVHSGQQLKTFRFWSPPVESRQPTFNEMVEHVDELLAEAVSLRLRADVPVGIFLSGGIDSGLVAAMASRASSRPLKSFTVGFSESDYDERAAARRVAEQYGMQHHEITLTPDIETVLPRVVAGYGEPLADPSAVPSFMVAEFAARETKVVLGGDGGDELFLGYRRHLAAARFSSGLARFLSPAGRYAANAALTALPAPSGTRSTFASMHRILRLMSAKSGAQLQVLSDDGFSPSEMPASLANQRPAAPYEDYWQALKNNGGFPTLLEAMAGMDYDHSLPGDLLVKMDIASMSSSLEVRSPFLDVKLVEYMLSIPAASRLQGATTKPVLRGLAEKYLPSDLCKAPKRGFELPVFDWLTGPLNAMCRDTMLAPGLVLDLFGRAYLEKLLKGPGASNCSPAHWCRLIWILLILALFDKQAPVKNG